MFLQAKQQLKAQKLEDELAEGKSNIANKVFSCSNFVSVVFIC